MPRRRTSDEVDFIFLLLIGGVVWYYRHFIKRVLIYLLCFLVMMLVVTVLVKTYQRHSLNKKMHTGDINDIDKMSGLEFEKYLAVRLRALGYKNIKLTETYDYGVDIIASKEGITWGIQVKRYSGMVSVDAVRQVVTGLKKYDCDKAMVITNSFYSGFAKELALVNNCKLIDRDELLSWL